MNWKYYKLMILPDGDPREEYIISTEERNALFKKYKNALLLRYTSDFDMAQQGRWYYCIKDSLFDINALKSKRRNVIKKAIANFTVRRINLINWVDQFHVLRNDAFQAYPDAPTFSYEYCKNLCSQISSNENSIILGAFPKDSEQLVGYLWLDIKGQAINMVEQHVMRDYEKEGCNTALDYAMCEIYNDQYYSEGFYLCDGERNITHETAFQDYLIKYFGFRMAYCRLHVFFNPCYAFAVKLAVKLLPFYASVLKKLRPALYLNICGVKKLWELSV